jgi:molecular chaperone DnaJ
MPVTDGDDHYAVLGVAADSGAEQIRDAYRAMARLLHPDRAHSDAAAARMARVNEAYYVLRDAGRRAVYDAARREDNLSAPPSPAETWRPEETARQASSFPPPERARFPWRWVLAFAAVGSLIVGSLSVLIERPEPPPPDNLLEVGSCVSIEANGDAREVACTDGADLVVSVLVSFDETCPYGTNAHRDRQGLGIACVTATATDDTE